VRNVRAFKQRLDRRDQHRIIGANDFAHVYSPACSPGAA
jgi:hypothetical protein